MSKRNIVHLPSIPNRYTGMGIYLKAFYSIVQVEGVRFRDAFEAFLFANQIYWTEVGFGLPLFHFPFP